MAIPKVVFPIIWGFIILAIGWVFYIAIYAIANTVGGVKVSISDQWFIVQGLRIAVFMLTYPIGVAVLLAHLFLNPAMQVIVQLLNFFLGWLGANFSWTDVDTSFWVNSYSEFVSSILSILFPPVLA